MGLADESRGDSIQRGNYLPVEFSATELSPWENIIKSIFKYANVCFKYCCHDKCSLSCSEPSARLQKNLTAGFLIAFSIWDPRNRQLPVSSWMWNWTGSCRRQSHAEVWEVLGAFQASSASWGVCGIPWFSQLRKVIFHTGAGPQGWVRVTRGSGPSGPREQHSRAALSAQGLWGLRQGSLISHTMNSPKVTWAIEKNQPEADLNWAWGWFKLSLLGLNHYWQHRTWGWRNMKITSHYHTHLPCLVLCSLVGFGIVSGAEFLRFQEFQSH